MRFGGFRVDTKTLRQLLPPMQNQQLLFFCKLGKRFTICLAVDSDKNTFGLQSNSKLSNVNIYVLSGRSIIDNML